MTRRAKCEGCDGSGWIPYMQRGSVNWWIEKPSKRPCQHCNMKAFGLPEEATS